MPEFKIVDKTIFNSNKIITEFEDKGQIVDAKGKPITSSYYRGAKYRIIAKQEEEFPCLVRIGQILARLAIAISFGRARHTKPVIRLLNEQKKVIYFGVLVDSSKTNSRQSINLDTNESPRGQQVSFSRESIQVQNFPQFNDGSKGEILKKLIEQDNLSQLKSLMRSPADFEIKDQEGNTPLINAVLAGKEEIVNYLVENGANLEATDNNGSTPLMWACCKSNVTISQYLLQKRAKIDTTNRWDLNAIFYAMSNLQILELLFLHGGNFWQTNQEGQTFLHLAAENNHLEAVSYFISQGLGVNAQDSQGATALHYACLVGNKEIVQLLLEKDPRCAQARLTSEVTRHRPIDVALWAGNQSAAIVELLLPFEINPLFPSFLMKERMLCHKFSINCNYTTADNYKVPLEYLSHKLAYEELQRSLSDYISRLQPDMPTKLNWPKVLEIFSHSLSNLDNISHCFSDVYPSDIISLPAGWLGHTTGLVVSKKHKILIKCDRSIFASNPGLIIYKIGKMENLEQVLQKVVENKELTKGKDYFCQGIDKDLGLNQIGYLHHTFQTGNTCNWKSSAMLVLRAINYLTFLEERVSNEEAAELSFTDYKAWDEEDRHESIKKFLNDLKQLQESLKANPISPEQLEQEGIIPGQVLQKVFIKCIREQRIDSLKLLLEHYPELLQIKYDEQTYTDQQSIKKSFKQALKWNEIELVCWLATQLADSSERHSLFREIIEHCSFSSDEQKDHIHLPINFLEETIPYIEFFKAIDQKDVEKAEVIASSLSNQSDRDFAFTEVIKLCLPQKEEQSLDISIRIGNQAEREKFIYKVVSNFGSKERLDALIDLAKSRFSGLPREWVLEQAGHYLISKGNIQKAREAVSLLPEEKPESKYLFIRMEILDDNPKGALDLFRSLPNASREPLKNQEVVGLLCNRQEYQTAYEFANLSNKKEKSKLFKAIISSLLYRNQLKEALDLAQIIRNKRQQSYAYKQIIEYMIGLPENYSEVERVIELIPKENVKNHMIQFVADRHLMLNHP